MSREGEIFYFSEVDDRIFLDSVRDPLGTQIVWAYFGQKIFKNKLTTIANDIRNYTINLFNHSVVKQLKEWESKGELNSKYDYSQTFYESVIIALENYIVYSVLSDENSKSNGLLGVQRARERLNANHNDIVLLDWSWKEKNGLKENITDRSKLETLKRQISLGVHGRYKTPFIEFGLFDKNLNYNGNQIRNDLWNKFNKIEGYRDHSFSIAEKIKQKLNNIDGRSRTVRITLNDLKENTQSQNNLVNIFSDLSKNEKLMNFWKTVFGFDENNEASLLFEKIESNIISKTEESNENIFNYIYKLPIDTENIKNIINVENFLGRVRFVFDLFLHEKINSTSEWKNLYKEKINNYNWNDVISNLPELKLDITALRRLNTLKNIFYNSSHQDITKKLFKYHDDIMASRGLNSWIQIKEDGTIINNSYKIKEMVFEKIQFGNWYHDYYISSLTSIIKGMKES